MHSHKHINWRNKRGQSGMTLLELLAVVAICSILAAFAYSSYNAHTAKARRTDAQTALMGLAQAMERHKTVTGSYKGAAAGGADTGAPAIFPDQAPVDGGQKFYNLTIAAVVGGSSYTIRATPIATGPQAGDGYLELLSNGQRKWDSKNDGSPQNCWQATC